MEGRALNRVDRNASQSGTYHEGVGVWETACNGSPAYIRRKHLNDIRFARPTLTVNIEAEGRLQDAIKAIEEIVKDNIV